MNHEHTVSPSGRGEQSTRLVDPLTILILSAKQTYRRLPFHVRASLWCLAASLPVITWPAAMAGFFSVIRVALCDPEGSDIHLRRVLLDVARRQFRRSLVLMLVDGLILAVMLFAVTFWLTRPLPVEHLLAGVAAPFLLFWWICQPFLFPVLVEYPDASLRDIYRQVVFVVFMHPLYALSLTVVVSSLALIGLLLLGPALLVLGPFAALIAIQGSWVLLGAEIPDLSTPVARGDRQEVR